LELARRLGDDVAYAAAAGFALTHVQPMDYVEVLPPLAAEFLSHPHGRMRTADLAHALSAAGRLLLGSGDRDAAERAWDELDGISAKSRDPTARLEALPNAAVRALLDGDLEVAASQLNADSSFVAAIGLDAVTISFQNRIASIRALHYLGQANDTLLDEFPGESRPLLAMRAFVRALLGRCDEALALRARFSGIDNPADATAVLMLAMLLEACVRCNDTSTARALFQRMAPLANRVDGTYLLSFGRLLGEAATLVGRPADARHSYEQALWVCQKIRFRPELALIRLDLAELLLNSYSSERARAADHLQTATAEFEAMHMQPSLTRALELSQSAAPILGRAERSFAHALDPLTERERDVAELLAQGKSNREIAATLVISESTAQVHVKHILSKLDLKSRSQVAAWAARRSPRL
jgi:DNA-binding CsgD family transcriptional regulator